MTNIGDEENIINQELQHPVKTMTVDDVHHHDIIQEANCTTNVSSAVTITSSYMNNTNEQHSNLLHQNDVTSHNADDLIAVDNLLSTHIPMNDNNNSNSIMMSIDDDSESSSFTEIKNSCQKNNHDKSYNDNHDNDIINDDDHENHVDDVANAKSLKSERQMKIESSKNVTNIISSDNQTYLVHPTNLQKT